MNIPIGVDDFKEIIEKDYTYVDKTLLIEEVIENSAKVQLITRPRRFGKTLNMSMLSYFFDITGDYEALFKGLEIEKQPCFTELGSRPVIFLSFKGLKASDYAGFLKLFRDMMSELYQKHRYLYETLNEIEQAQFLRIEKQESDEAHLLNAIERLTGFLERHHGKKVVLLIDEYDSPIDEAYHGGFYEPAITFMRGTLGGALKGNLSLHKAVLTGILRISKESIFSDLNHIEVHTVLETTFASHFGFTESETLDLLKVAGQAEKMGDVQEWYNGYNIGNHIIYNPWSVLNYLKKNFLLQPHWVNTSSNNLIHRLLTDADPGVQETLTRLIKGGTVETPVYAQTTLRDLDEEALWSLLLFSGYLTSIGCERQGLEDIYSLKIPNLEVVHLYKTIFHRFVVKRIGRSDLTKMLKALTEGKVEIFAHHFTKLVREILSFYDTATETSERVYHAFVLGLMANLDYRYHIRSNRESGYGRYDLMMIPMNPSERGVLMEFKVAASEAMLEAEAQAALAQIEEKSYVAELEAQGVMASTQVGIAFCGKQVLVVGK